MHRSDLEVEQFLFRKKSRKALRSLNRHNKFVSSEKQWQRESQGNFGRQSTIIKMLAKHAVEPLKATRYKIDVRIKKVFSIIEEPKEAVSLLTSFALALRMGKNIRNIVYQHQDLENHDLAANAILDLITVERKVELKNRGSRKGLKVSGTYPRNQNVRRFIKAMGIIKHMDIHHEAPTQPESEKLRIFDARNRHYLRNPDASKADFKDKKQTAFVDHIDSCLKDNHWVLSDDGKQALGTYAGEILSNAEDHAGFVDWTVQGYLDNSLSAPMCEIAIFNFGKSIADTLKELPKDSYAWKQFGKYIEMHSQKGFFGNSWREEDLLTVVALQQHISSKNFSAVDSRGQGTVHFIDFFQQVHRSCAANNQRAQMAIVSGSTYILFDGTYSLKDRVEGGKTIAFNNTDDLNEKPDSKYVKSLGNVHFPGTIISIKFPIAVGSSTMVEEIQDEQNVN